MIITYITYINIISPLHFLPPNPSIIYLLAFFQIHSLFSLTLNKYFYKNLQMHTHDTKYNVISLCNVLKVRVVFSYSL